MEAAPALIDFLFPKTPIRPTHSIAMRDRRPIAVEVMIFIRRLSTLAR